MEEEIRSNLDKSVVYIEDNRVETVNNNMTEWDGPTSILAIQGNLTYETLTDMNYLEKNVKQRAKLRDITDKKETTTEREINLEESSNDIEALVAENNVKSNVKRLVNAKSHRFGKTKKSKMNTSVEKLNNVDKKIKSLRTKLNDASNMMTSEMALASYEDIYSEIRSADRYYAEGISKNKDEEKFIKAKADMAYYYSLIRLYDKEKALVATRISELEETAIGKNGQVSKQEADTYNKKHDALTKQRDELNNKMAGFSIKAEDIQRQLDEFKKKGFV